MFVWTNFLLTVIAVCKLYTFLLLRAAAPLLPQPHRCFDRKCRLTLSATGPRARIVIVSEGEWTGCPKSEEHTLPPRLHSRGTTCLLAVVRVAWLLYSKLVS